MLLKEWTLLPLLADASLSRFIIGPILPHLIPSLSNAIFCSHVTIELSLNPSSVIYFVANMQVH